jgi:hypothetical protein
MAKMWAKIIFCQNLALLPATFATKWQKQMLAKNMYLSFCNAKMPRTWLMKQHPRFFLLHQEAEYRKPSEDK